MSALVVIPARFGSVRFPGKPLAVLSGKPIIQWVYEQARQAKQADEVIVATDDERIAHVVRRFGGEVMMTSPQASSGTDRVAEVVRQRNAHVIVNAQGDEPLIKPEMVDALINCMEKHSTVPMASLMTRLTRSEDVASPNVVKTVTDKDGFALYFSRSPIPFYRRSVSDDKNPGASRFYWKHLGIYAYQRDFILKFPTLEPTALEQAEQLEQLRALEHGYRIKLMETPHDTIGVDTPDDLKKAEALLAHAAVSKTNTFA